MAKNPVHPQQPEQAGHGEGFRIQATITKQQAHANGVSTAEFSIELGDAPAPQRKFVADGFSIVELFDQYRLIFVQRRVNGINLRAMLELRFTKPAFKNWLGTINATDGLTFSSEFLVDVMEEPEQTVALEVNFLRSVGNDTALSLDFYYVSGLSLNRIAKNKTLFADASVRVQVTESLFNSLIYTARKVADQ